MLLRSEISCSVMKEAASAVVVAAKEVAAINAVVAVSVVVAVTVVGPVLNVAAATGAIIIILSRLLHAETSWFRVKGLRRRNLFIIVLFGLKYTIQIYNSPKK